MDTLEMLKSLKGGEFLVKDAAPETIFTNEEFTEEHLMIKSMASDFVEKEVIPFGREIDKKKGEGLVPELLEKAGALGLLGTAIPEQYGGMEQDVITGTILAEEFGRTGSFATAAICHVGIGTLPILYFGNEEQKAKYLPKLATGEWKASYCLTEPGSGSDALGAKTTAVLSADGTKWILNGQKMWITNAGFADVFTVFAKIDGKDFTGFIVEKGTPGLNLGAEEDKMGIKGSSTRQVFFENCEIPAENMLGERGKGHKIAFNILNIGRYKLGSTALGGARQTFNLGVRYALDRNQFGVSIATFGAIKYKIAEQAIKLFALEAVANRVAMDIGKLEHELKEQGKSFSEALLGAAEEYSIECAISKVFGSEVLDYVVDETVQIHGGMGFSEETDACRAYRDSRIARIYEGTNEINRLLTVDMLLKRAMSGKIDMMSPAMAVAKELTSIPDFGSGPEGTFGEEEQTLKNAKKAVLMVAGAGVQKLMQKLKDEQEILMNVADMIIDVYAMESLLARVKKIYDSRGETEAAIYMDVLKVFFNDAVARINFSGKEALQAFTGGDELRMMLMGLKRFTKYSPFNTKDARRRIADSILEAGSYNL
ncbi:MAG: acyl-CoA dehydrogenase family protein [Chitinophagales bacterium]|nr:acyl-CoA dehydrogenase family protein [Chitinophagales bacterium]